MAIADIRSKMRSNEEIIGRADLDDPEAILSVTTLGENETFYAVKDHADAIFTWDYRKGARPALNKLYEKAKTSQWNGETDLPWDTDVDVEKSVRAQNAATNPGATDMTPPFDVSGTALASWGDEEFLALGIEMQNHLLSQFMHGEQGALICTAKIVETVPWIDAKYYAATQVMDEARHVEVFARYIDEKTEGAYPINPFLQSLLDDIIGDGRWDMTYLGMQIMVEGLALAAFGFLHMVTTEPLLKQLLRYVMSDEARHVAFGVLSLQEYYAGLSAAEIRERQEFAADAAARLQQRFMGREVFERLGADPDRVLAFIDEQGDVGNQFFQAMLFSKIVPNCKKLGLLDAGDGWLRRRFTDWQIIQFEDWADTSDEYETFDLAAGG
jgi:hypothetical protein